MSAEKSLLQKIVCLCSRHGYIYKGQRLRKDRCNVAKLYDLGPLGTKLKQNLCQEWWYSMVTSRGNVYGTDSPSLDLGVTDTDSSSPDLGVSAQQRIAETDGQKDLNSTLNENPSKEEITSTKTLPVFHGILQQYLRIKDLAHKQIPFGAAQRGINYQSKHDQNDNDRFIYDSVNSTQLSLQYYCSSKAMTRLLDTWQRERLNWWRKFAENPSNFIATDLQTMDDSTQILDIQYKFPWGFDSVERICNHGNAPMDQLMQWMQEGLIDVEDGTTVVGDEEGSEEMADDGAAQEKKMVNLLKGREGRKSILPHTLEMTTTVERGMLAYLFDGYTERDNAPKSRTVGPEVINLHAKLAPVKIAIVTHQPSTRPMEEISEYLQTEFRKSNINVIGDSRKTTQKEKIHRFDAMGVVFSIWVQEQTIKEGVVNVRGRGEHVLQGQHITKVKELALRHLEHT